MVDKVKPLKIEDTTNGSSLNFAPKEANPDEDFLAAKGIAFENSDNTTIRGDIGVMKFKDSVVTTEVDLEDLVNVFGLDSDESTRTTSLAVTGSSFTTYDTLNFTTTETSGTNKYRIACDFLWSHNSAANDIRVQLIIDANPPIEIRMEPKDANNDQRISSSLIAYVSNLSAGAHTATLQFRPATASRVSTLYRSVIEVWRTE